MREGLGRYQSATSVAIIAPTLSTRYTIHHCQPQRYTQLPYRPLQGGLRTRAKSTRADSALPSPIFHLPVFHIERYTSTSRLVVLLRIPHGPHRLRTTSTTRRRPPATPPRRSRPPYLCLYIRPRARGAGQERGHGLHRATLLLFRHRAFGQAPRLHASISISIATASTTSGLRVLELFGGLLLGVIFALRSAVRWRGPAVPTTTTRTLRRRGGAPDRELTLGLGHLEAVGVRGRRNAGGCWAIDMRLRAHGQGTSRGACTF
ncbi:hypothetical protein C8Q73DRAFT_419755 [Cubamyces lactineus]|nr:hypothetical protein C8Q73DRAFT_419755 [Cubamyces lactineus]